MVLVFYPPHFPNLNKESTSRMSHLEGHFLKTETILVLQWTVCNFVDLFKF